MISIILAAGCAHNIDDLKEAHRMSLLKESIQKIKNKKLFIFDLDGTVILGGRSIPYVKDFLELIKINHKQIVFLSNNSSKIPLNHINLLNQIYDQIYDSSNIYTSIDNVLDALKERSIKTIYVLGVPEVIDYFKRKDYRISEKPDAVIVTFDTSLTYETLSKVCLLFQQSTPPLYILSNPDLCYPSYNGYLPDAGSITALINLVVNKKPDLICGKPSVSMLEGVLLKHPYNKDDCIFFGDRLYTDFTMGSEANISTILTLTGETKMGDLDLNFFKKNIVINNFKEIIDMWQ